MISYNVISFLVASGVLRNVSGKNNSATPILPDFIPSAEWKEVKHGQAIPAGIHVRHNFETGITEGKLMDNVSTNSTENQVILSRYSEADLNVDNVSSSHRMNVSFNAAKKFRSLEELRQMSEKLNLSIKSDGKIIQELFAKYKSSTDEIQKCSILDDLAEYLHQYDNADDFASDGRLSEMVQELPYVPTPRRIKLLQCLSSASQGNPPVQLKLMESGFLEIIGRLLQQNLSPSENLDLSLLSHSIFALTTFLRHFHEAQSVFLQQNPTVSSLNGSQLLHLLAESSLWQCQSHACIRLQLKILNFIGDLLGELADEIKAGSDKFDEYSILVLCHPWRQRLLDFLTANELLLDHDLLERLIRSGIEFTSRCSNHITSEDVGNLHQLLQILSRLEQKYRHLAEQDDDADELGYFKQLHDLVNIFKKSIFVNHSRTDTYEQLNYKSY